MKSTTIEQIDTVEATPGAQPKVDLNLSPVLGLAESVEAIPGAQPEVDLQETVPILVRLDTFTLPGGKKVKIKQCKHGQKWQIGRYFYIKFLGDPTGSYAFRVEGKVPKKCRKPGDPPRLRKQFETYEEAYTYLQKTELEMRGLRVEKELKPTTLPTPWLSAIEKEHDNMDAYKQGPNILGKMVAFYRAHHKPGDHKVSLQALLNKLIDAKGVDRVDENGIRKKKRSSKTVAGWRAGVHAITRLHGPPTGKVNRLGRPIHDMPAEEVTVERLKALEGIYGWETAMIYNQRISAVLQHGVQIGDLETNWAQKVTFEPDKEEGPPRDVSIFSNAQVQSGLNMAARLRGGRPLPIFVLKVYGALRPDAEIPHFSWEKVDWLAKCVTVYSSKTGRTRTVELCAVAMGTLKWCFDRGIEPECTASDWGAIRMAMGYFDSHCPRGLWPDAFEEFDLMPHDGCRHTGNSNRHRYNPDISEGARWSGDAIDTYMRHYVNGRVTLPRAAQYHVLQPDLMPRTPELTANIRQELVKHNLIDKDDPLPEPPVVPLITVHCPQPQRLPSIPDKELGQMIWATSLEDVATAQGMNRGWLAGYCIAKGIPVPPRACKRNNRIEFEDAPAPPPLVTISHEALHDLIWAKMGLLPAAKELRVRPYYLKVYCIVHDIKVPTRRTFSRERAKAASMNVFRAPLEEVKERLSNTDDFRTVAQHYKIPNDKLIRFCQRHQITPIPGYVYHRRHYQYSMQLEQAEPSKPNTVDAVKKAAVGQPTG